MLLVMEEWVLSRQLIPSTMAEAEAELLLTGTMLELADLAEVEMAEVETLHQEERVLLTLAEVEVEVGSRCLEETEVLE